jgi:hypothetical protein
MVRYTHFEAADGTSIVADGHRVMCLGNGERASKAATAQTAREYSAEWVVVAAEWCGAGLLFVLAGLCRLVFRGLIVIAASLVLPLVHEFACLGGAAVLYPLGAAGRLLASAVERAGVTLSERSLALGVGRRVLGALRGQLREASRGQLRVSEQPELAVDKSRATALAVRGCDV